jgi:hypothetical protein
MVARKMTCDDAASHIVAIQPEAVTTPSTVNARQHPAGTPRRTAGLRWCEFLKSEEGESRPKLLSRPVPGIGQRCFYFGGLAFTSKCLRLVPKLVRFEATCSRNVATEWADISPSRRNRTRSSRRLPGATEPYSPRIHRKKGRRPPAWFPVWKTRSVDRSAGIRAGQGQASRL